MRLEDFFSDSTTLVIDWDRLFQLPEFRKLEGCRHDETWHRETVKEHVIDVGERMAVEARQMVVDDMGIYQPMVCIVAAILHDIGKPDTSVCKDGKWICPMHATVGANIARRLLGRDVSLPLREEVCWLISNHMFFHQLYGMSEDRRAAALLTLMQQRAHLMQPLLMLYKADCLGNVTDLEDKIRFMNKIDRIESDMEKVCKEYRDTLHDIAQRNATKGMYNEAAFMLKINRPSFKFDNLRECKGPEYGVYVMIGLPGSGKNTYLEDHMESIALRERKVPVVVSLDEIRKELRATREYPSDDWRLVEPDALQVMYERIENACKSHTPIVINNTNLPRRRRMSFIPYTLGTNAVFHYICMDTDVEECIARRNGVISEENIREMASRWEFPQPDEYDIMEVHVDGKAAFVGGTRYQSTWLDQEEALEDMDGAAGVDAYMLGFASSDNPEKVDRWVLGLDDGKGGFRDSSGTALDAQYAVPFDDFSPGNDWYNVQIAVKFLKNE